MANAPSFGATIGYDMAGGTSYTSVGKVKDIEGPGFERGTVEFTNHDSTSGFKEFFGGLVDPGEMTFSIGFDNLSSAHSNLYLSLSDETCTPWAWLITCNTCSGNYKWAFKGFVTGINPTEPVEGENQWEVTIKVTGKPTLTASA